MFLSLWQTILFCNQFSSLWKEVGMCEVLKDLKKNMLTLWLRWLWFLKNIFYYLIYKNRRFVIKQEKLSISFYCFSFCASICSQYVLFFYSSRLWNETWRMIMKWMRCLIILTTIDICEYYAGIWSEKSSFFLQRN